MEKIIIIPAFFNSNSLVGHIGKSTDVLALTPIAMLSLDILNIPYKTTKDFYNTEVYRRDIESLHKETEKVFSELDEICEKSLDFPYAYTGNISYFLTILADLLYLDKLSQKIEENYNKIYLFSNTTPGKLLWGNLKYSEMKSQPIAAGLSMPVVASLEKKKQILHNILHSELIPDGLKDPFKVPFNLRAEMFIKKSFIYFRKFIKEKNVQLFQNMNISKIIESYYAPKRNIYIIQDDYEISLLKHYMFGFKLINPVLSLRERAPSIPPVKYDFIETKHKLDQFLGKSFPKLQPLIESLFSSYHREIVGRIVYFKESFEELIDRDNPEMLLFSVGCRDVVDSAFAYIANKKNIPIFYFQHGGPGIFINNYHKKYVEADYKTKKTLILNSKKEFELDYQNSSGSVVFGSMTRYRLLKDIKSNINEKILYCCSPFPFHSYRQLMTNEGDTNAHQINRDILAVSKEKSISIDIKLHPTGQDYNFHYFNMLIDTIKCSKAKIIYNIPAEFIMKSYGLIIVNSLALSIISYALSLKIPIIVYMKNNNLINSNVLTDIKKRCYIVHNYEMLSEIIKKYQIGNLDSKWSLEMVDRYVYPIENGNPCRNIANYLKSVCNCKIKSTSKTACCIKKQVNF